MLAPYATLRLLFTAFHTLSVKISPAAVPILLFLTGVKGAWSGHETNFWTFGVLSCLQIVHIN